ncbi:MAG TPA: hypothetical protein PLD10_18095 [Rhodopila sp.]|nr:hypothetical protein [Rhodopila sp.]
MSRHLLIAGTGRAGTSFLVRYLTGVGMDTQLSRAGAAATWDDNANAGFENLPSPERADLPYVLKSPWTYQVIHDVLASGRLQFDAVILPMRDLTEAAASRSIIEMQDLHQRVDWMDQLDHTWEHFGHTPGGVVYSLNPLDQARLLAVGFHQLLEALVRADIPVVLLAFPRFVNDAGYLFRKLAHLLPDGVSQQDAARAHAAVADPAKVRVGAELHQPQDTSAEGFTLNGPGPLRLERAALMRVVVRMRHELAEARAQLAEMRAQSAEAMTAARAAQAETAAETARWQAAEATLSRTAEQRDMTAEALRLSEAVLQERQRAHQAEMLMRETEIAALRSRLEALEAPRRWPWNGPRGGAARFGSMMGWFTRRGGRPPA